MSELDIRCPKRLVIGTQNEGKLAEIGKVLTSSTGIQIILGQQDIESFPCNIPETETDFEVQAAAKAAYCARALPPETWCVSDDSGIAVDFGDADLSDSAVLKKLRDNGIDLENYELPDRTFVNFANFPLSSDTRVNLLAVEDFPGLATGRIARLFGNKSEEENHEAACALYKKIHEALHGANKPVLVNFVSAIAIAASPASAEDEPKIIGTYRADLTGLLASPGKKGPHGFGYDANFIPLMDNRRRRSYAQMPQEEKALISPRAMALTKMQKHLSEISFDAPYKQNVAYIKKLRSYPDLWDKENNRWRPNLYPEDFSLLAATDTTITSRAEPSRLVTVKTLYSQREIVARPEMVYNGHFNGLCLTNAVAQYGIMSALPKYMPHENQLSILRGEHGHLAWKVVGIADLDKELGNVRSTFEALAATNTNPHLNIMVDASNGHMLKMSTMITRLREEFRESVTIVAGNVVTSEMTERLIKAGADGVKGNHGPAEICDTHTVAGEHSATLTTTLRCAEAAHKLGGIYICDGGGLSTPGNAVIQLVAGADFLMTGGLWAGLRECDANFVKMVDPATNEPYEVMEYHGGASEWSLTQYHGGVADHRPIEGRTRYVRLKAGGLEAVVRQYANGIASAASFCGVMGPHGLRGAVIEPTRRRRDYRY